MRYISSPRTATILVLMEKAWTFISPILDAWEQDTTTPLALYEPGSDGPKEADDLIRREGRRWTEIG